MTGIFRVFWSRVFFCLLRLLVASNNATQSTVKNECVVCVATADNLSADKWYFFVVVMLSSGVNSKYIE